MTTLFERLKSFRNLIILANAIFFVAAFTVSHLPGEDLPSLHVGDKTLHIIGYFGLGIALLPLIASYGFRRLARVFLTFALLLTYGTFDELTQPLFGRTCDYQDLIADGIGSAAAILAVEIAFAVLQRKKVLGSRQLIKRTQ